MQYKVDTAKYSVSREREKKERVVTEKEHIRKKMLLRNGRRERRGEELNVLWLRGG